MYDVLTNRVSMEISTHTLKPSLAVISIVVSFVPNFGCVQQLITVLDNSFFWFCQAYITFLLFWLPVKLDSLFIQILTDVDKLTVCWYFTDRIYFL
jgi:hypothetical protein